MILSHIVAASANRVIGRDGSLPWHLPEDLKFFKQKTLNHAIIMGRKTFSSIKHPLPKRLNIVITRQTDFHPLGVEVFPHLKGAINYCEQEQKKSTWLWGDEVFIVGGGEIYTQSLPLVDRIYLTQIHQKFSGDTFYPPINETHFKEISRSDRNEPLPYSFITLERVTNKGFISIGSPSHAVN